MILDGKAVTPGDLILASLDGRLNELHDFATADTHQMVMVTTLVQLKDRLTTLEMVPGDQPRALELGQHPIDGRKADVLAGLQQRPVDVFRAQVALVTMLQHCQDLDARTRDLKASRSNLLVLQVRNLLAPTPASAIRAPDGASGL